MSNLHYRLSCAIAVSAVAIGSSLPVVAQPLDAFAPPVEAVLANVRSEATKTVSTAPRLSLKRKSVPKVTPIVRIKKTGRHVTAEPNLAGLNDFINSDRQPNYTAVNQLIE
jgi:predicted pyridoxine 5'-phosphate oxidase superfamily flavin-nucleotide-binding protein